ncbi:hypothetical protein SAY86_006399 [Trapa natans]|uniref:Pentatricopeptide repeat-containing protein n=1 Tax=Trapa natans TaxID=22666 RepID=A0AAN7L4H3_TRANT|nr:hypothetical protein SAY86_006399 [Trapa natans]
MAKLLFSALHQCGYKLNMKIYQTMIHYLCKGGEFGLAYTICVDSMGRNWFPNVDTISALLQGLKKNGQIGRAIEIVELIKRRTANPKKEHNIMKLKPYSRIQPKQNHMQKAEAARCWYRFGDRLAPLHLPIHIEIQSTCVLCLLLVHLMSDWK